MRYDSPLQVLHEALASVIHRDGSPVAHSVIDHDAIPKDGPRPAMRDLPRKKVLRRPCEEEYRVVMFPQTWGSTALGYGGLGGAAMSEAYTVVAMSRSEACVYFGGGTLAYRCKLQKMTEAQMQAWREDLGTHRLKGRRQAIEAYGATLDIETSAELEDTSGAGGSAE